MDPGQPETKHHGNNRFQEGKNPESSRRLLDLHSDEKGPSPAAFGKSKYDGNLSTNTSAQTPPRSITSASTPPIGVLPLLELSTGSFGSEIFPGPLEAKPPPVKTTKPAETYDPNRIPASIFSSEPTNPADWSIASNDSLFSIQNSFSRNSSFLHGMPDYEHSNLSETKSNEPGRLSVGLPLLVDVPAHKESIIISGLEKKASNSSPKIPRGETVENKAKVKKASASAEIVPPPAGITSSPNSRGALPAETTPISSGTARASTNNPRLSDGSTTSSSSFAFPVLVKDAGKSDSANWATENREKPQLLQEQQQVPEETPKASKKKRFCCFPCWCRCCCCC